MWKIIPNTENNYAAEETGIIKRCANTYSNQQGIFQSQEHILTPWTNNSGYQCVSICLHNRKKNKLVHKLIAQTFMPDYDPKLDINHLDGDKQNNALANLEMCSRSDNLKHYHQNRELFKDKTVTYPQKLTAASSPNSKPISMIYPEDKVIVESFESIADACRKYNLSPTSLSSALHKRQQTAYGYIWEFDKDECND